MLEVDILGVQGLGLTPKFRLEEEEWLELSYQEEDIFRLIIIFL